MRELSLLTAVTTAMLASSGGAIAQAGIGEVDVFDRFLIEEVVLSALAVPDGAVVEAIRGQPEPGGTTLVCGRVNAKSVTGEFIGWLEFSGVLYAEAADPTASRFRRLIIGKDACPLPPATEAQDSVVQSR